MLCASPGFRVYKSFDPRARVMRRVAHEVLQHLNITCAPAAEQGVHVGR